MNEIPTRRAWAPFVGAALAMLTTGSLVVFALVAQRTSLDGFSNDRVAAVRPASAPPAAITIPGGSAPSGTASDDGSPTGDDAAAISVASPDVPVAAPSFFELVTTSPTPQRRDTVALASPSDNGDGGGTVESPNQRLAEERALFARGGGGEPSDGEREGEVAGSDPRHDGKHSHKSHDAKDKAKKAKKSKKAKGQRSKAGSPGRRHASRSNSSSASRSAPRPESSKGAERSSGSPQTSQNARQSSGPPPHSNAGGGGNGKARGRGHGKR